MRVPIKTCEVWLASIWFLGSAVLFLLLVFQSFGGTYTPLEREVWEWFLPNALPTLSLIVSVLALDALGMAIRKETVDPFYFRLTAGLSLLYLILMVLTILVLPLRWPAPPDKLAFLKMSNLWLGPLQGLVTASLGVFFVKQQPTETKPVVAGKPTAPGTPSLTLGQVGP